MKERRIFLLAHKLNWNRNRLRLDAGIAGRIRTTHRRVGKRTRCQDLRDFFTELALIGHSVATEHRLVAEANRDTLNTQKVWVDAHRIDWDAMKKMADGNILKTEFDVVSCLIVIGYQDMNGSVQNNRTGKPLYI